MTLSRLGSMFTLFFRKAVPSNFTEAKECDTAAYAQHFWNLIEGGVYTACSQFETNFVSLAHTEQDLAQAEREFVKSIDAVRT